MTLRNRFLLDNLLLVLGLLAIGCVSVLSLASLRNQVTLAPSVYSEIKTITNVAVDVGTAKGLLVDPALNRAQTITHLEYAIGGLDQFVQVSQGYGESTDAQMKSAYQPIDQAATSARDRLQQVVTRLRSPQALTSVEASVQQTTIDAAMEDIDKATSSCIHFISSRQESASNKLTTTFFLVGSLSIAAVIAAIWLGLFHNRLAMRPLQRLREGVRAIAASKFIEKLDPATVGSRPEFRELAAEFNQMATELDEYYRRLEEQVRAKSQQLIRSERLASVGFLAAGVAHEINNPLNIISGYAEITTQLMEAGRSSFRDEEFERAQSNLKIIREEAFRCKDITEMLLSLSRNSDDNREEVDLAAVVRDVATMTRGLKPYRNREITLKLDSAAPLAVRANITEMKQVVLNLTINALEAAEQAGGKVCIEGRHQNEWIEICVSDNGRGIGPEVLPHVFEPFFTSRRGSTEPGTGLGLSISHAIMESHHGRIDAASAGLGRGSQFTIRLPARRNGEVSAAR